MKKHFLASILVLMFAALMHSCSGGGNPGGTPSSGIKSLFSKTAIISGTVSMSSSAAGTSAAPRYRAAPRGSYLSKTLTAAGVKKAVELPALVNATIKLYNADRPDWIYPIAQVFTDSQGMYKLDKLTNSDLNTDSQGNAEYKNGDPVPAGNYTIIATNDTTVSGGKQLVAVQTFVKYFEGAVPGNDLVVQDSDAPPAVTFMFGIPQNADGTFGGATTTKLHTNAGIQIIFNMAMARLSVINAVTVKDTAGTVVKGTWAVSPDLITATFYPNAGELLQGTDYTVTVEGGLNNTLAAVNVYGKPILATVTGAFHTYSDADKEGAVDSTSPNVTKFAPMSQTGVPIITPIQIGSNEALDINTIKVSGTPSIGDKPSIQFIGIKKVTIGLTESDYYVYEIGHTPLSLDTDYAISVSEGKDMSGISLSPVTINFKTEATSAGVTGAAGTQTHIDQVAVKDMFGKWVNAMNARNAALLTTNMTGNFYWLTNGWSKDDENRDGRLSLAEFRKMLDKDFTRFDYCGTIISGDTSEIAMNGATAGITFTLTFTHMLNKTDPLCATESDQLKYAELEKINGAWLFNRGSDRLTTSYPPSLDSIELSTPANGIQFAEPLPSKPLNPDFAWTAVAGVKTYAIVLMDKGKPETGWVALVDGASYAAGSQATFGFTGTPGASGSSYVLSSGDLFGFTKSITKMVPGGYYVWSVLGFKTAAVNDFVQALVTDPTSDLGASSMPFNYSVANNVPPTVISTTPANDAVGVAIDASVVAEFSEKIDAATITDGTFLVTSASGSTVAGTVAYDALTSKATFQPSNLQHDTKYTAKITTGVKDVAGNQLVVDYQWVFTTADVAPPTTTATPTGGIYNKAQSVLLSADETAVIRYTIDGSDPLTSQTVQLYSSKISIPLTTTLKFYAEDPSGNKESVKTETYTIDTEAGTTSATPPGGIFNFAPSITLTATETAVIYYTTDGNVPSATSPVYSAPIKLTEGTTVLRFFSVDSAGNNESVKTENYAVDLTAPVTTAMPAGGLYNRARSVTLSADEQATIRFTTDGTDPKTSSTAQTYSAAIAVSSTTTLKFFAEDAAGNEESVKTETYTIDSVPPVVTATPSGGIYKTGQSVVLSVDKTATIYYTTDGSTPSKTSSVYVSALSATTEGTTAIRYFAEDTAGNISNIKTDIYVIDLTAPDTTIQQTPQSVTNSGYANFVFISNEPDSTFQCALDDPAGWTACSSPKSYDIVSEGTHTFWVRTTDAAGNVDTTPASYTWVLDTTPPTGTVRIDYTSTQNAAYARTTSVNLAISAVDTYSTVQKMQLSNDGQAWYDIEDFAATKAWTLLSVDGPKTVHVRFRDAAGNWSAPVNDAIILDGAAPETTITAKPANPANSANATFSFISSEPSSSFLCRTYEQGTTVPSYAACTSPASFSGLAEGKYQVFEVYAIDPAGNVDASPATHAWQVDTVKLTTIATPPGGTFANDVLVTISTSSVTGTSVTRFTTDGSDPKISVTALSTSATTTSFTLSSSATLKFYSSDSSETEAVTAQVYDIDKDLPTVTITGKPAKMTFGTTAEFSFAASEPSTFDCRLLPNVTAWAACSSPTLYPISEGTYTFEVRATDLAGNTGNAESYSFTRDVTPPSAAITVGSGNPQYAISTAVTLTISANAGTGTAVDQMQLSNDGMAWFDPEPISATRTWTLPSGDGVKTVYLRVRDAAGNWSQPVSDSIIIDTAAPNTTITLTPPRNTQDPSFTFVSSELNSTFMCREYMNGASPLPAFTACTSPKLYTGLTDSMYHNFEVYAVDAAGNADATPATYNWRLDVNMLQTTASPAGGLFNGSINVTITVTGNDGATTTKYTLDGTDPLTSGTATSIDTTTATSFTLPIGSTTTLKFYSKDMYEIETVTSLQYTIDIVAPTVTINNLPVSPNNSTSGSVTFSADEAATYKCRVTPASLFTLCSSPYNLVSLPANTTINFEVYATDTAGNVSTTAAASWVVDTAPPAVASFAINGGSAYTSSTGVTLNITASDNLSGLSQMQVSNDGTSWTLYTSYTSTVGWWVPSGEGQKTVYLRLRDAAGNWSQSYTDTIIYDTTPPETSITGTPANPSTSTNATFYFNSTEAGSSFEYRLYKSGDAAPDWSACSTGDQFTGLMNGYYYVFDVRAIDPAGNTDTTHSSFTWLIDTSNLVSSVSPAGGLFNADQTVTISVTGMAGSATLRYTTDGSDPVTSGTAVSITTDPQSVTLPVFTATTTLKYYAYDISQTEAVKTETYSIDKAAPVVTITSYPASPTNNSSATFYWSVSETATSYCRKYVAGSPTSYAACASPVSYSGNTAGTYQFDVYAVDTAGNAGTVASYQWTVDTTAPTGSVYINGNAAYTNSTYVTLTISDGGTGAYYISVSNDGTTWSTYYYYTSLGWTLPSGDGTKTVYIKFGDAAGNWSTAYGDTIILDTIAPNTSITGAPANPLTVTYAYLYFSSTESGSTFKCRLYVQGTTPPSYTTCTSNTYSYYSGLANGTYYTFDVYATDAAGNADATSASYTWRVDTTGIWDTSGVWDQSTWGY